MIRVALVLLFLLSKAPLAWSGDLEGTVHNALDGSPIPDVQVRIEGLKRMVKSDEAGRYHIRAAPGAWRLSFSRTGYSDGALVNQRPLGPAGQAFLWPEEAPLDFQPLESSRVGLWGTGRGPEADESAQLRGLLTRAAVPGELPSTIRVARYFSSSCTGEIQRIDTIDFDDYVRGVVNAEVGVFQGVEGGPESAAECWKAFAVAARSYALHFILTQPYDGYDINDTACNQVYSDNRNAEVSAAVDATHGQILVKASDPEVIDRYFYAASCAEHGTEPAYATGSIIPDETPVRACVGSWCGHDNCAGHRDNPNVPGDDRCLVWGTCQWGSVERSMAGETYDQILAHYQPNCIIRDMGGPILGSIKGVVYRQPDLDDRIFPAQVWVEDGPSQTYEGESAWNFDLEPGTYTIHAEAEGYLPGSVERTVGAFETVWGSIGLEPAPEADAGTDAGEVQDAGQEPDASQGADEDSGGDQGPASDAGGTDDGGSGGDNLRVDEGGCNCGASGAPSLPVLLSLLLLPWLGIRRRN